MRELANVFAETSVLGAVLYEGVLFHDLVTEEKHFYDARHRMIFRAMKAVVEGGQAIDIVTVTTALGVAITQVGGTTYLLEMAESIASTAPFKDHEQLILDAYRLRKSREVVLNYANDPSDASLKALIQQLQNFEGIGLNKDDKTVNDYLLEIADDMCFPSTELSGVITEFPDLDDMTGGLQKGDLIIVAARPSVGKTAFALQLATTHVKNNGYAHFYSLEMGVKQLLQRMISSEATINSQKWRHKLFLTEDYERGLKAIGDISGWNLLVSDSIRSVRKIRAAVRREMRDMPDKSHLVIIDYLQLMNSVGFYERRDLEIGHITKELKQLAIELDVPVVLLSQLSRGIESRHDKRPLMSDLRESGNIEQDADVIAFLYRDDYYNHHVANESHIEVNIAKQRNGPVGTIKLGFDKEYGRFTPLETSQVE